MCVKLYKCACAHVYGHLCLYMCICMCMSMTMRGGCVWRSEVNLGYPSSPAICLVILRQNHLFRAWGCLILVGRWPGNLRDPPVSVFLELGAHSSMCIHPYTHLCVCWGSNVGPYVCAARAELASAPRICCDWRRMNSQQYCIPLLMYPSTSPRNPQEIKQSKLQICEFEVLIPFLWFK